MSKVIAIHQPNYFPWLGYINKIANCDSFVILDSVDINVGSANSITNRTKVKLPSGESWLTVPLKKGDNKIISDVHIDKSKPWQKKQLKTLFFNYQKAPFFEIIYPEIEKLILKDNNTIAELNIDILRWLCRYLEIKTEIILSSNLNINTDDRNDRIIMICQKLNGTTYYSGKGGRNYHNEELFRDSGIKLTYTQFEHPNYTQLHGDFIEGLSVIDVLFNCGKSTRDLIK